MSLVRQGFIRLPPGARPGFDHADTSRAGRRVYVAHTGADRVDVIDCEQQTFLRSLMDLAGVAGVLMLGARAARGRTLVEGDDRPEAPAVAVVSHRFWTREMGGSPTGVGQVVLINGVAVEIVGVAAPGFRGTRLDLPELWIPIALWPRIAPTSFAGLDMRQRNWGWLRLTGRLAPGATRTQAEAAMEASARGQAQRYPGQASDGRLTLAPAAVMASGGEAMRGRMLSFFGILMGVVGLVLLIACANVANLLLARSQGRRREIAVRRAVGASAARIVRQLLTEALLLSLLAGGLSLLVAQFVTDLLGRFTLPGEISPASLNPDPGGAVLSFTLFVSLATALLFGLAPALRGARPDLRADLKDSPADAGKPHRRLRSGLLVIQVTLSLVLLTGAGLFLRSLQQALSIDLGFRPERIVRVTMERNPLRQSFCPWPRRPTRPGCVP